MVSGQLRRIKAGSALVKKKILVSHVDNWESRAWGAGLEVYGEVYIPLNLVVKVKTCCK